VLWKRLGVERSVARRVLRAPARVAQRLMRYSTIAPVMRVATPPTWADTLHAMDMDKAAWMTVERALARVPLVRRRKVRRMLKRKGRQAGAISNSIP
jgi:hypothetical protein